MKNIILASLLAIAAPSLGMAQLSDYGGSADYEAWDDYRVEAFYENVDVERGPKDEDGDDLDFIFVPVDLDNGVYQVEIAEGPGDLYQIEGTDFFVEFAGFYGMACSGDAGVLVVSFSSFSTAFHKQE